MFLELPKIMNDPTVRISPFVFLTNALAAFGEPAGRVGGVLHALGGAGRIRTTVCAPVPPALGIVHQFPTLGAPRHQPALASGSINPPCMQA